MKRILLSLILLLMFSQSVVCAEVTELVISPDNPVKGDILDLTLIAGPNEDVSVTIYFEREVTVTDGKYVLKMDDVLIPEYPNKFTAEASNVEDMTVAMNIMGWVQVPVDGTNGQAIIVQENIPPGTYDSKILGFAKPGETTVTISITAETILTTNSNGEKHYTYPTIGIPVGDISADVGDISRTITLSPVDSTAPRISDSTPIGTIDTLAPIISATYTDTSEIDLSSVIILFDTLDVTLQSTITESGFSYQPSGLANNTSHELDITVADSRGNTRYKSWTFSILLPPVPDLVPPTITTYQPTGNIQSNSVDILASFFDNKQINTDLTTLSINGVDVTGSSSITQNSIQYHKSSLVNQTEYQISLSVTDTSGNIQTKNWSFTASFAPSGGGYVPPPTFENQPPVSVINEVDTVFVPFEIVLDGSNSYDLDGIIIEYQWVIDSLIVRTGATVKHQILVPGTHSVQLTVRDNMGKTSSSNIQFNSLDSNLYKPTPVIGDKQGVSDLPLTFDASKSYSIGGEIVDFRWNYDDGYQATGIVTNHIYNNPGVYNASLTIIDSLGASDVAWFTVTILEPVHHETPTTYIQTEDDIEAEIMINTTTTTTVTLTTYTSTDVILIELPDDSFNSTQKPRNSHGKIVDIVITDLATVSWPIYVEREYNETQIQGPEDYLALYYYMNDEWHICSETGVNTTNNTVYAFMTQAETLGSPTLIAEFNPHDYLELIDLSLESSVIKQNETISITINIENNAASHIETRLDLKINDEIYQEKQVILSPGSQTVTFTIRFSDPGETQIDINGTKTQIQVIPLTIDLYITPPSNSQDYIVSEASNLLFTIGNSGEITSKPSTFTIQLNETFIHQETIPKISANNSTTISYEFTPFDAGIYQLTFSLEPHSKQTDIDTSNNLQSTIAHITEITQPPYLQITGVLLIAILGIYFFRVKPK